MALLLWFRTKRLQYGEWLYWRKEAIKARRKRVGPSTAKTPGAGSAPINVAAAKRPPR